MIDLNEKIGLIAIGVFRLNGVLNHWGDAFVAAEGLTAARWQMLGALYLAGMPQTCPQLAAKMGMTRQGAQKQLNLLLEGGLVSSRENAAHKRAPLYALSERGTEAYTAIHRRWQAEAERAAAALTAAEIASAEKVISNLIDYFSKEK